MDTQTKDPATEPTQLGLVTIPSTDASQLSIPGMLQQFIAQGVTTENVAAFEKLVALYERMQDKDAEKQFAQAFTKMQSEMPVILALKAVPNKDGSTRYHFAPYESIMEQVKPLLEKHGFTVTFSMGFNEGRVIQTCTLQHIGGHSRSNQFMARVGNGPPGSSEAQGDGAASTYAKRFALCNALNIICEADTDAGKLDARNEGAPISWDQVCFLKEQVRETGSNEAAFLKYAGVTKYEEISANRYDSLLSALETKKRR